MSPNQLAEKWNMDGMMGTKEAAERWGCDQALVWELCRSGLVEGAVHLGPGRPWRIPKEAKRPAQARSPEEPERP